MLPNNNTMSTRQNLINKLLRQLPPRSNSRSRSSMKMKVPMERKRTSM